MPVRLTTLHPRPLRVLTALVLVALTATALSVPYSSTSASAASAPEQPNILLVTTDDQATTDMRFMPYTRRFFARNGVTFTDAVSPFPLCCPARATIMTGQLTHNHRVHTNMGPHGGYPAFLDSGQQDRALPTWLDDAGYRTMFVGKYLNGYGPQHDFPPGWDEWHATAGTGVYSFRYFQMYVGGVLTSFKNKFQTDVVGDQTRAFIKGPEAQDTEEPDTEEAGTEAPDEPFFIWESNLAPHGECRRDGFGPGCRWGPPTPAWKDRNKYARLPLNRLRDGSFNERVVREKPAHVRGTRAWGALKLGRMTHWNRQRARSLRGVDRSFRQTIQTLEDTGELKNTLVIFTSDNGYLIGQHRWSGKTLPYQPSLGVPMMMAGPGVPVGKKVHDTVALVDVAPTVADAADAEPTLTTDGRSMMPVATGRRGYGALSIEAGPLRPKDWPTWFYRGVRTQRYTYVRYPGLREAELYDRRRDPHEMNNVAYRPAYRKTLRALAEKLSELQDCKGRDCYRVGARVPRPRPERYLSNGATVHPDELGSIGSARRVVTITAPNWRTGRGRLTAWVRHRRTWTVQRGPFAVQLGARGMIPERQRRHSTGETPAGTFAPQSALGLEPPTRTALPYRRLRRRDHWVFDPRDPATYNVNQARRSPRAGWRKTYALRWASETSRFPRALLIDYNLPSRVRMAQRLGELRSGAPADVRKGSFVLHAGQRLGRHGWVSMRASKLTWLLRWVRPRGTRFVVGTTRHLRTRL